MKKFLIIRLSSFGDIVQCLSVTGAIKHNHPGAEISFLTKKQFAAIASLSPDLHNIISFDNKKGLKGWIKLCLKLREENFDVVYDAHSNIRTIILRLLFIGAGVAHFLKRPKSRLLRVLLFKLRINKFDWPFQGMESFHKPLKPILKHSIKNYHQKWDFSKVNTAKVKEMLPYQSNFLVCSPSAAWEMKRWPLAHWKSLFAQLNDHPVIILGGPEDGFCEELVQIAPDRVINLAGKLSLIESCYVVSLAKCFISADTGLVHVAEILNKQGFSIIGPTAFGFPTHKNITTLETQMSCRPCTKDGRGKCSQSVYQQCLVDIKPSRVASEVRSILKS